MVGEGVSPFSVFFCGGGDGGLVEGGGGVFGVTYSSRALALARFTGRYGSGC